MGATLKVRFGIHKKAAQASHMRGLHEPDYTDHPAPDGFAPVVKAVETLAETGDFHVTTIGDHLPNENEIRENTGRRTSFSRR